MIRCEDQGLSGSEFVTMFYHGHERIRSATPKGISTAERRRLDILALDQVGLLTGNHKVYTMHGEFIFEYSGSGCGAFRPRTQAEQFKAKVSALQLTQERNSTHGSFEDNAAVSQEIKTAMRASKHWDNLSDVMKESLEMIALKISRILSGHASHADHWHDIQGYAELAKKGCFNE